MFETSGLLYSVSVEIMQEMSYEETTGIDCICSIHLATYSVKHGFGLVPFFSLISISQP